MKNETFNKKLKSIFNKYSQDKDINSALYKLWMNNNLYPDQTEILDEIKNDLEKGQASCAEKYFIKNVSQ